MATGAVPVVFFDTGDTLSNYKGRGHARFRPVIAGPDAEPGARLSTPGWITGTWAGTMRMTSAVAICHVAFEDLGLLAPLLARRGIGVRVLDAVSDLSGFNVLAPDLLVVLGGPIGAYDDDLYPFLIEERALLASRLTAERPTLGICLGAQMMARALGAAVYPGARKEIGWAPIQLTAEGTGSCLAPLGDPAIAVLHWHGDTFDLPAGATRLASTPLYENQAFVWGRSALALQFHIEATADGLERWYVGHACELAGVADVTVPDLRAASRRFGPRLRPLAEQVLVNWLDMVEV